LSAAAAINSRELERDLREKPLSAFSHPGLAEIQLPLFRVRLSRSFQN
jgi:hypothetical protein